MATSWIDPLLDDNGVPSNPEFVEEKPGLRGWVFVPFGSVWGQFGQTRHQRVDRDGHEGTGYQTSLAQVVRPEGFEPSTLGLRVPCSTN